MNIRQPLPPNAIRLKAFTLMSDPSRTVRVGLFSRPDVLPDAETTAMLVRELWPPAKGPRKRVGMEGRYAKDHESVRRIDSAKIKLLIAARGEAASVFARRIGYTLDYLLDRLTVGVASEALLAKIAEGLEVDPTTLLRSDIKVAKG